MKFKKGQAAAMTAIFIIAIIGIVTLGATFQFLTDNALTRVTGLNETVAIASGVGQSANDRNVVATSLGNASYINLESSAVFNVTGKGSIIADSGNYSDNDYQLVYAYDPTGYVTNATARTLTNVIPILFVLLIFTAVAGFLILKK